MYVIHASLSLSIYIYFIRFWVSFEFGQQFLYLIEDAYGVSSPHPQTNPKQSAGTV